MTTHTIARPMFPSTAVALALDEAIKKAGTEGVVVEVKTPLTITLSELLSDAVPTVRRQLLSSFLASLNLGIITRLRDHLSYKVKTPDRESWGYDLIDNAESTLDKRNEEDDQLGQNAGCYDQGTVDEANAAYAGNPLQMSNFDVAKRLCVIRSFIHIQQAMLQQKIVPDFLNGIVTVNNAAIERQFKPRSLQESVDWLIDNTPQVAKPDDVAVQMAYAVLKDSFTLEQVVAVKNADLAAQRELYPDVVALGEDLTNHFVPDEMAVEQAFDSLPVIVRLNLLLTAANACTVLVNNSLKAVLRRGKLAAAGDLTIGRQLHARVMRTVQALAQKHQQDINDLYERGGQLKELKTLALPSTTN